MKFTKKQHLQIISIIVILLASIIGGVNLDKELKENIDDLLVTEETSESAGKVAGSQITQAIVTKIVDGDTIQLETGETVRYIGIDTPETKHPTKEIGCFGSEASKKNEELVLGKTVTLEKDISETDRYGRLLRYVFVEDEMINERLVREGYASATSFPPDIRYQEKFREAEKAAQDRNVGLWGSCEREP